VGEFGRVLKGGVRVLVESLDLVCKVLALEDLRLGDRLWVREGVCVGRLDRVRVGVCVGRLDGVCECVGEGSEGFRVGDFVPVREGVRVGSLDRVGEGVREGLGVGEGVLVREAEYDVSVRVPKGVRVDDLVYF